MEKRGGLAEALRDDPSSPIPIRPAAVLSRKLGGPWLDAFIDYMEPFGVPELFSVWAGLATLSAVIERRLWHTTTRGPLHPGIYTFLVGPAAAGKTLPINEGRKLIEAVTGRHVAPSNITRAAFVDELNESRQTIQRPGEDPPTIQFNSLSLMLIGACTPGFLSSLIPIDAWEQGFMSRVTIVYAGMTPPIDLWAPTPDQSAKFTALVDDLRTIGALYGVIDFTDEALDAMRAWHLADGPPAPSPPQLKGYIGRRTAHLIKLCILICASCTNNRVITLDHYQEAHGILTRTEFVMADVFLAMRKGGDGEVMKEAWWFAYQEYRRHGRALPHHMLMRFLSERTPNHNIERMINVMIAAHLLERQSVDGVVAYVPRGTPGA